MNRSETAGSPAAHAPEPLEVGFAWRDKSGEGFSRREAARQLVQQALNGVHIDRLPVRCLLLLATADWCREPSATLPREVRRECKNALGYEVPLIGGSMASLFYLTETNHIIEHGLILVAFCSHDFWATVSCLDTPHRGGEAERQERVNELARELQVKAGIRLGASAARHLLGFFPGIFLNERNEPMYLDDELHEDILAAFGYRHRVVGGAAADALTPTVGYQFADDKCLKSGLALAMVETDLAAGMMMGHGFSPDRDIRINVDKLKDGADSGYEVAVLDRKPAKQRMAELRRKYAAKIGQVFLGAPDGPDYHILCGLSEEQGAEGCIRLNRRVRRGDRLFLLKMSGEQMAEAGRAACGDAIQSSGAPNSVKIVCGLTCTGRVGLYERLGPRQKEVIGALRKAFPTVPIVGGLCAGGFGLDHWRRLQSSSFSCLVNSLASSYAPRAAARVLQGRLLAAGSRLSNCQTPRDVMAAALAGAIEAGATGGQVCIVDYTIGRILGLDLGCASSLAGSGHDWSRVAASTDRPAADPSKNEFPRYLLNWSLPVDEGRGLDVVASTCSEEDILTLVVRTGRAVFVADYANPIFHAEPTAAEAGHVVTFLAIPLLGSDGKAIATLQVSFRDYSTIDRESFGLWVGYAQKLAAALERAQEAEERNVAQGISRLGNMILQEPADLDAPPHKWCDRYLREVVERLGADDAHIRLLQKGPTGEAYRLVAAAGQLAELRRKTRPVTRPGEGSCNLKLLEAGGRITNTREETRKLNEGVKAIQEETEFGADLIDRLNAVEATAMLPLKHEGRVLGSLVIDSTHHYFFTQRRGRLARSAAELGGAIMRGKLDAYDRAAQEREKTWLLKSLAEAKEGATEIGLQGLLSRLCGAVRADVGSLFLWCEPVQKLILHTSCGWSENLEGKANYAKGEGWTGTFACADADISIVGDGGPIAVDATRKYYDQAIPFEHRVPKGTPDPRIGVRLKVGGKLVGVVTFSYFRENQDELRDENRLHRIESFFGAVTDLIILAVEDAKAEAARKEDQRLLNTKNLVVQELMEISGSRVRLRPALDDIRQGFELERVVFYRAHDGRIEGATVSLAEDHPALTVSPRSIPASCTVHDLLSQEVEVLLRTPTCEQLEGWPHSMRITSMFAVRVPGAFGDAKGVLELVNRRTTRDHPFAFLDESEQSAARDVARAIGAALEHQEHELAVAEEEKRQLAYERMQADLQANREKADHEKAMRDAFEDFAHQIKSPLAEAARRVEESARRFGSGAGSQDLEAIATLLRHAEDTAKLIGLFASLVRGGRLPVKGTPHTAADLVRMASQVCDNHRPRISPRRNICINCDADSFYRHAPSELSADPELLLQALNNIVDNAVKYSYSNTVITVFGAGLKRGGFFVGVMNKGIPIATHELHLVKQRNWRGEAARAHVGEGNGLGLWIADHIMRAHGGELQVLATRQGDGVTEMRLAFPLAK